MKAIFVWREENFFYCTPIIAESGHVTEALEVSRQRRLFPYSPDKIEQFWNLVESRARELDVVIGDGLNLLEATAYDTYLDTNTDSANNPVQRLLMDHFGLSRVESRDLYSAIQVAYRMGGRTGGELAYREFFESSLWYEAISLSSHLHTLSEIFKVKLEQELLGTFSVRTDLSNNGANLFLGILEQNSHPLNGSLIALLESEGINIQNRERVREYIVDNIDRLIANGDSEGLTSVLKSREDRYREAIASENDPSIQVRHAYGPLSKTARTNEVLLNVIRLKGFLGASWGESMDFAEWLVQDYHSVLFDRPTDYMDLRNRFRSSRPSGGTCRRLFSN